MQDKLTMIEGSENLPEQKFRASEHSYLHILW